MTTISRLGLALPLVAFLACDTKSGSVGATATAGSDDGTGTSGGDPTGNEPTSGDPTGDEPTGGTGSGGGNCVETEIPIDLDTQSVTGVHPNDVLADVEATYSGTFRWGLQEGPVLYTGSTEPTPVQVQLSYDGGEIRDIDAELVEPCQHDGPCPCADRLEIDVTMRIVSDDGVLDETWVVTLNHHVGDDTGFSQPGTSVYHRFDPDQTQGTLDLDSFAVDEGVVLEQTILTIDLGEGAMAGGVLVEVSSDMGWFGAGGAAGFGAVTEVTPEACATFYDGTTCGYAGCTSVAGRAVYGGGSSCDCNPPQDYCFAAPLQGEPQPTLYTRKYDDGFEVFDEVVAFDTLVETPEGPWRLCADAPEVQNCACFEGTDPC